MKYNSAGSLTSSLSCLYRNSSFFYDSIVVITIAFLTVSNCICFNLKKKQLIKVLIGFRRGSKLSVTIPVNIHDWLQQRVHLHIIHNFQAWSKHVLHTNSLRQWLNSLCLSPSLYIYSLFITDTKVYAKAFLGSVYSYTSECVYIVCVIHTRVLDTRL